MGALGYPFVLLTRRPAALMITFVLLAAAFVGTEILFASIGQDVNRTRSWAMQVNNLITGVYNLMAGSFVMGAAMVDLKRRTEPATPSDGLLFFVLNLKFMVTVALPALIFAAIVLGVVGASVGFQSMMYSSVGQFAFMAVPMLLFLPMMFFVMRLYLAWPMSLTDGRPQLWRAWGLSRGHFWLTTVVVLASYVIAFAPLFISATVLRAAGVTPLELVDTVQRALMPDALTYTIVTNGLAAFASLYTAIVAAHLYDQFAPQGVSIADEF